jgi:Na+-transporting methylmalonyl-CoA/oxaloacetate decarboxylase gamma subunit
MGIAELLIIVIPLVGQLVRSVIKDARDEKKSTWEKMADVATTAWEKTTDAAERIPELSGNQKVMRALDLWRALL